MSLPGVTRRRLLIALALPLLVVVIYGPVITHGFVAYDDPDYVSSNAHVLGGISAQNLRWAWTSTSAANWFPLTWLTLMLQAEAFGTWAGGYHVVAAFVHGCNGLLLWWVLTAMTARAGRSAVVALLFTVHPMHVESVAWAAEWKDVLSTCFALLCLRCYERYVRSRRGAAWYAAVVVTFGLSLLAKPMYVTLPALMLLLDVWPLGRFSGAATRDRWGLWVEKLPLLVLAVGAAGATVFAQTGLHAVASGAVLPASTRAANAMVSYTRYLQKLALPIRLAVFYPYPPLSAGDVAASAVLLLGVSGFALLLRHRQPALLVGWAWFVGTLIPVIGLVQVGAQSMADRYSYFPSVGIYIAVTWSVAEAVRRSTLARRAVLTAAVVMILGYTFLARQQVGYWQNTQTLFEHADAVTTDNWVAALQLGNLALAAGDRATAAARYQQLTRLQPADGRGYNGLANSVVDLNTQRAIALYRQAVQRNPRSALFHLNLAKALARQGDRAAALAECRFAEQLDPSAGAASELARQLAP